MIQFKNREEKAVVCALLSIWFYVIIQKAGESPIYLDTLSDAKTDIVFIIDPGHGGMDGGAVSANGTAESSVNWQISRRLRDLLVFSGLRVCMTRDREEIEYPSDIVGIAKRKRWDTKHRAEYVNSIENGILISIHQNFYPSQQPRGAQVLYAPDDDSRMLGEALQSAVSKNLQPDNRRKAVPVPKDIYLLNHVSCPAVLLECGFLSNPSDAADLVKDAEQIKLSCVLTSVLCDFLGDESA